MDEASQKDNANPVIAPAMDKEPEPVDEETKVSRSNKVQDEVPPVNRKVSVKKASAPKQPVTSAVKKKAIVKKQAAQKAEVKKATPVKKSGRRGIRLKSDIDDE